MAKRKRYKIRYCHNQMCIDNGESIVGHYKGKKKDIPICGHRGLCPDAHLHYFDYRPEYVRKEGIDANRK